ncbi:MAG: aminoglycoside phosphotransferase family protein [Desulfocapsaceae bacterium]|nr:aminoglycoside phosphotransferase family protein [Desulfocapsaceae bacterium]
MRDKTSEIHQFLRKSAWLSGEFDCTFLAAGEYNENYLITSQADRFVFRINHDTQLGLSNQIEYEYQVLEAVSGSGVTPKPFYYDLHAGGLGKGALLMEFLPGKPLDYDHDLEKAAEIFARIHRQPLDQRLIVQEDPACDIATESKGLIERYPGPHYPEVRACLLDYHGKIIDSSEKMAKLYNNEHYCIVNTEVNSGNFLIAGNRASLVDWEKAVVSYRYQDLAHFLIPTTTLWKTSFRFSEEEKYAFLGQYLAAGDTGLAVDEVYEKTRLMERVILLRALSWCYMAYHEYTAADRELTHDDTFTTITSYLDEAECFLE